MKKHNNLDIAIIPEKVLYINIPQFADSNALESGVYDENQVDPAEDNIRIYVPLDLNHSSILRRLHHLYNILGEPDENNEMDFNYGVSRIFEQLDIYDRVWFTRKAGVGYCKCSS
jgi:hypothetical protein